MILLLLMILKFITKTFRGGGGHMGVSQGVKGPIVDIYTFLYHFQRI